MKKAQRLIDLMITINSKRKFTLKELADEFQVSKRTIQRDLDELEGLGFPLYSEYGVHGGYRVLPNRLLPPVSLTSEEAVSIFFASQMLKYYRSLPFKNEMLSTLKKFEYLLPDETKKTIEQLKHRLLFWVPENSVESPFLEVLLVASLEQTVLNMTYESESGLSCRIIQPIGIYAMNGHWYCPAYCFTKEQILLFRVDRVKNLEKNDVVFPKPDISQISVETYVMTDFNDGDLHLVVQLSKRGVLKCKSDFWLSKGVVENDDGTGVLRAKISSGMVPWAASYFLALGTDAFVQEPAEVISYIKEHILQLSIKYPM